jgi:multisite-specific tRNA:(cytosine-C5)-methyltransferase
VLVEKKKEGRINAKDDYQNFKVEDLFEELTSFEEARVTHPFVKSSRNSPGSFFSDSTQEMGDLNLDRTMRIMPHDQNTGGFYVAVLRKTSYVYFTEKKIEEPDAPTHGKIIQDILTEHLKQNSGSLEIDMDEDKANEKQSLKFDKSEKGNKMQNFKTAENYTVLSDEDSKTQILDYYGLRKVIFFNCRK